MADNIRRNRLQLGHIDMISLVDHGDNPEAHVMIHKAKETDDRKKRWAKSDNDVKMRRTDGNDDRLGLIERLAEYLGVNKANNRDGPFLDQEDTMTKEEQERLEKAEKALEELQKEKEFTKAVGAALDEVARAETIEDVDKVIASLEDVEVIKAVKDRADARKDELAKVASDDTVEKFRKALPEPIGKAFDEMDETAQAAFMKSYAGAEDDPLVKTVDTLAKKNAALEERLEKVDERDELRDIEKELEPLKDVIDDIPEMAKTIRTLRKSAHGAADAMLERYKALAEQAKTSDLFKITGRELGGSGDADAKIEKAAEEIRKANPDLTSEQAYAKALDANPGLYTEHLDEKEEK